MKKSYTVVLILIILITAAALGLNYYLQSLVQAMVDQFIRGIPGVTAWSGDTYFSFLNRCLTVTKMKVERSASSQVFELDQLEVRRPDPAALLALFQTGSPPAAERQFLAQAIELSQVKISAPSTLVTFSRLLLVEPSVAEPTSVEASQTEQTAGKVPGLPPIIPVAFFSSRLEMDSLEIADRQKNYPRTTVNRMVAEDWQTYQAKRLIMDGFTIMISDREKLTARQAQAEPADFFPLWQTLVRTPTASTWPTQVFLFQKYQIQDVNITLKQVDGLAIKEISIVAGGRAAQIMDDLTWKFTGVELTAARLTDARDRERLKKLGLETLTASARYQYFWEPGPLNLDLKELFLDVSDVGQMRMSLQIEALDGPALTNSDTALGALGRTRLKQAELAYVDRGLVDRILGAAAKDYLLPVEAVRILAIEQLRHQPTLLGFTSSSARLAEGLISFLQTPQRLTITARPSQTQPLQTVINQALFSPTALLTTLNVTVTVNDLPAIRLGP